MPVETDAAESVLAFFTLSEIGRACNLSNWTIGEEIRILAGIAKGEYPEAKTRDRILAVRELRRNLMLAARLAGRVQETEKVGVLTASREDGQVHLRQTERTTRLLSGSAESSLAALEEAVAQKDVQEIVRYAGNKSEQEAGTATGDSSSPHPHQEDIDLPSDYLPSDYLPG